ncbi:MAG TPA: hypothetical protein VGW11_08080 [Solirubrobacteraceae bacterium]|nr:hypothetical protein [Solirubrobacteraceae bacterium]
MLQELESEHVEFEVEDDDTFTIEDERVEEADEDEDDEEAEEAEEEDGEDEDA